MVQSAVKMILQRTQDRLNEFIRAVAEIPGTAALETPAGPGPSFAITGRPPVTAPATEPHHPLHQHEAAAALSWLLALAGRALVSNIMWEMREQGIDVPVPGVDEHAAAPDTLRQVVRQAARAGFHPPPVLALTSQNWIRAIERVPEEELHALPVKRLSTLQAPQLQAATKVSTLRGS